MIPELQIAKPQPDATAELARGFETRAAGEQPELFSPAELPRLWTLEEAAQFLGMSPAWVRDHSTRRRPFIPCVRMGGVRSLLRYRRVDLVQFINDHWQPTGNPQPKK